MKGRLICFEGTDGSGKGSQIRRLAEKTPGAVFFTYPDKGWEIGRIIAKFLRKRVAFSPIHQFLLYAGDIHKDQEKINGMLEQGKTVILDRYIFSTISYQGASGFGTKRGIGLVTELGFLAPDIAILLDINPKTSVERKKKQNNALERFEKQRFLKKVRANYLELARNNFLSKKWFIVDGERSEGEIAEEISLLVLKSR